MAVATTGKKEELLAYARSRQQLDRRWSSIYWHLHNWFRILALVSQLLVFLGLASMIYVPDVSRNSVNVVLLVISFVGFTAFLLDLLLHFGRRSKLLADAAEILESAIVRYNNDRISERVFLNRIKESVSRRREQQDD